MIDDLTEEENKQVMDDYRRSLASAIRSFHGESCAAREVALLHAKMKIIEIRIAKKKAGAK